MAQQIKERLLEHLHKLQADPAGTSLDKRLIDEADLVLPEQLQPQELLQVVQSISATLQTIQQDPSQLTTLLEKLLIPFSFTDVLSFDPPVDFVSGLSLADHMVSINKLMLYLLEKATQPADVATIAGWPEVFQAFIHLWLSTSDTGVALRASHLLVNLLTIDKPALAHPDQRLPDPGTGQGLVWKRLLTDRDVYGTIYNDCDLKRSKQSKNQVTLAQARLLEVLPKLAALDWTALTTSHHHDVEAEHGAEEGLLSFASLKMVDYKDDVLTHCVLVDFYTQLLVTTRPADNLEPAPGLDFLLANKIHERVAGIYLQSGTDADPIEAMFLYGPAANYLATYASLYSRHYLDSPLPKSIEARLLNALSMSAARWAHSDSPKHDLHLLASLPRKSLLPGGDGSGDWSKSPLFLLPSRATNPDVLNTLATIFHGPVNEPITFPETSALTDHDHETKLEEAAAARALYLHYLVHNQQFWKDIAQHADTVALVDLALAAIRVLTAVITANWSTKPEFVVPSSAIVTPENGHVAILSPPALEYALPYLMKPPQTFSNLVGGRGDAESAAYKIAMAKYDALQVFHKRLAAHIASEPDSGLEDVLATLGKRLAEGPMSRSGEVGGRIATLEL